MCGFRNPPLADMCPNNSVRLSLLKLAAASGTALFPGLPHSTGVVSVSANSDGSEIVTVTSDGTARLWRIPSPSVPPSNWLGDYLRAVGVSFSAEILTDCNGLWA
jgi:WD40 repeat protein